MLLYEVEQKKVNLNVIVFLCEAISMFEEEEGVVATFEPRCLEGKEATALQAVF